MKNAKQASDEERLNAASETLDQLLQGVKNLQKEDPYQQGKNVDTLGDFAQSNSTDLPSADSSADSSWEDISLKPSPPSAARPNVVARFFRSLLDFVAKLFKKSSAVSSEQPSSTGTPKPAASLNMSTGSSLLDSSQSENALRKQSSTSLNNAEEVKPTQGSQLLP